MHIVYIDRLIIYSTDFIAYDYNAIGIEVSIKFVAQRLTKYLVY